MNPTQKQDNHGPDHPSRLRDIVGLFTDPERFRAWIATAGSALTGPATHSADRFAITEHGRQALADAETSSIELAPPAEAPGTAALVLRLAAKYLELHGWTQGAYYDPTATSFTPAADMVGAIAMVCYGGPCEAPAQHFDDPGFLDFEEAVLHLDRYLLVEDGSEAYEFNDARGRRVEDVIRVLRDAACRPAEELVDALRTIQHGSLDQWLADRALLLTPRITLNRHMQMQCPCCGSTDPDLRIEDDGFGLCNHGWHDGDTDPVGVDPGAGDDDVPLEGHVDYPHVPGSLYDCPRCDRECFCADGFRCVHCATLDELDALPPVPSDIGGQQSGTGVTTDGGDAE